MFAAEQLLSLRTHATTFWAFAEQGTEPLSL